MIGLRLAIVFNQWEAKPKPIAPCTRDFSRASSELQVIPRNCDWFMALFVPVMIGRIYCFGFGFSTVIWKPLYPYWKQLKLLVIRTTRNRNLEELEGHSKRQKEICSGSNIIDAWLTYAHFLPVGNGLEEVLKRETCAINVHCFMTTSSLSIDFGSAVLRISDGPVKLPVHVLWSRVFVVCLLLKL